LNKVNFYLALIIISSIFLGISIHAAYAQENQSPVIRDFTINQGQLVEWFNTDNVAHAPTSGNPYDGPSGIFAISPIQPNQSFELLLDEVGTIEYFCMVHPWENGVITVNLVEAQVGEPFNQPMEEISQSDKIPEWVKTIFEAWINNRITENEFISAIQFLVETGVILVN